MGLPLQLAFLQTMLQPDSNAVKGTECMKETFICWEINSLLCNIVQH